MAQTCKRDKEGEGGVQWLDGDRAACSLLNSNAALSPTAVARGKGGRRCCRCSNVLLSSRSPATCLMLQIFLKNLSADTELPLPAPLGGHPSCWEGKGIAERIPGSSLPCCLFLLFLFFLVKLVTSPRFAGQRRDKGPI